MPTSTVTPQHTAMSARVKPPAWTSADVLLLAGGVLTGIIAILATWLMLRWDFLFISYLWLGVVPIGASGLGMLSASGFLGAARWVQRRPAMMVCGLMVLLQIPAYFGHYYAIYRNTWVQSASGEIVAAREVTDFVTYYQWDVTGRTYSWDTASTPEEPVTEHPVGTAGYLYALLELVGFVVGGLLVMAILLAMHYCATCQSYFRQRQLGSITNAEVAEATLQAMQANDMTTVQNVLRQWQRGTKFAERVKAKQQFSLALTFCSQCKSGSQLILSTLQSRLGQQQWKEILKQPIDSEATQALLQLHTRKA